jgi:ABC-type spermidine/putrescine transport system permease subunit I
MHSAIDLQRSGTAGRLPRSALRRVVHRVGHAALAWPALLFVALFFMLPMGLLVRVSLYEGGGRSGFGIGGMVKTGTWSTGAYRALLGDGYFAELLGFTLSFGFWAAAISVALGFGLALMIHRLPAWARLAALCAVFLPKLANVLVIVYGLVLLLGDFGPVNALLAPLRGDAAPWPLLHNLIGALIGEVYLILPYAVLLLVATLDRIPPMLVPAARGLGAGAFEAFWRVTLPLCLPGLATTFLLCLIFGLGAYVAPTILGSPNEFTLSVDIQRQAFENLNWPRAAAESVMMLVCVAALCGTYGIGAAAVRRSAAR